LLDKLDDFVIEEGSVGAHADWWGRFRQLGKSALQQRQRDRRNVHIARMVASLSTVLRPPFAAQQRKIRGASALLRVVAHGGSFLVAVGGQHGAVQIEKDLRRVAEHLRTPTVVQLEESVPTGTREPFQKAPQTGGFRIARQAGQIMKDPVVAQRLGGLDPSETQDQRVEEGFQGLADAVAVIALDKADVSREGPLQTEALKKLLDQSYASKLGQADPIEGNAQISWASVHCSKTTLSVRF